jgi:hypothetical protein
MKINIKIFYTYNLIYKQMKKIEKYDSFIKEAQELPEQSQDDNNSR